MQHPTTLQPAVQTGGADTRDQVRNFIAEQLSFAATQIACARMFVDISDDAGLTYSVTAAKAHFRAAVEATNDLNRQSRTIAEKAPA